MKRVVLILYETFELIPPSQTQGFDKYGLGHYACCSTPQLQAALSLEGGCVSSGNSLGWVQEDMDIMTQHAAVAKEMEAAAIAWVCDMFDVPFLCVKAVTDIVDGDRPSQDEFLENLSAAARSLQVRSAICCFQRYEVFVRAL